MKQEDLKMNCLICKNELKFIIKRNDKYSYYKCKNCNLITCFPKLSDEELKEYYTGFSNEESVEEKVFEIRKKRVEDDVERIVRDMKEIKDFNKKNNLTLLDFGGGVGFYSNGFSKQGFDVTLFEIDKKSIDYVKKHFNNFKITDKLSNEDKFDIVYCNQVIEHVKYPDLFLQELKNHIKEGGLLIITTPNQQAKEFYFRPLWFLYYLKRITGNKIYRIPKTMISFIKSPWICCDPPRHLYSFNKRNIQMLLKNENLIPIKVFTEYSTMQYYTLKSNCNLNIRKPKDVLRFIHNIYAIIGISFIKFLDKQNKFGGGLIAYAEKNRGVRNANEYMYKSKLL